MTAHPAEGQQAVVMEPVPWLALGLKPAFPYPLVAHQPPPTPHLVWYRWVP